MTTLLKKRALEFAHTLVDSFNTTIKTDFISIKADFITIAKATNVSHATALKYVGLLEELKIIKAIRNKNRNGNVYVINLKNLPKQ